VVTYNGTGIQASSARISLAAKKKKGKKGGEKKIVAGEEKRKKKSSEDCDQNPSDGRIDEGKREGA